MRYVSICLIGALIFSGFMIPVVARRVRLHSTYGWMLASAFFGLLFRPLYLLLFSSDRRSQENLFWRDIPTEQFMWPAVVLATAALVFAFAYLAGISHSTQLPRLERLEGAEAALMSAASLLGWVGIFAAVLYVRETGGFDVSSLSTKRVVANSSGDSLASVGPVLALGRLGLVAAVVSYHMRKASGRKTLSAALLLLGNVFLPFYASDRTGVLLIGLQLLALASFRAKGRVSRRTIATGLVALVLLFQVLSTLRTTGRSDSDFTLESPVATAEVLVFNRSFFDLSKNLHVVRATGNELDTKFGATFASVVIGPIPRSLWPNKPIVSPGPEIGRTIYDLPVTGVPPGFFAEGYWNFKFFGMLFLAVPFGLLCGRIDSTTPRNLGSFAQVVYCILLLPLAYNAVASSFSGVALDVLRDGVSLIAIWQLHTVLHRLKS